MRNLIWIWLLPFLVIGFFINPRLMAVLCILLVIGWVVWRAMNGD